MQGRATVVEVLAQEVLRGQRLGQRIKGQGQQQSMAICFSGLPRLLGFRPLPPSRCRRCRPCPSECSWWRLEVGNCGCVYSSSGSKAALIYYSLANVGALCSLLTFIIFPLLVVVPVFTLLLATR